MTPSASQRTIAFTAAGIFAGAALVEVVQQLTPGGPGFSAVPGFAAVVLALLALLAGPRLPHRALVAFGPLSVAVIAYAVADAPGSGDVAVLYLLPVLWIGGFFGRRATVFAVACVGVAHAVALAAMPPGAGTFDRWVEVMLAVVVGAAVVRTLTARNERLASRLVAEARIDPLTGLLNRRGLDERLGAELQRALRDEGHLGVVAFDVDHFEQINDEHGPAVGDRVLAWLGTVLTEQVRGVDLVARVRDDELLAVLPRADADAAHLVAERIRAAVASPGGARARFGLPDELSITLSAGIGAGRAPVDARELFTAAEAALYAAKRGGRDRTVVAPAAHAERTEPAESADPADRATSPAS
jgi:diguanylate cyclase (GGDEF)-like protein